MKNFKQIHRIKAFTLIEIIIVISILAITIALATPSFSLWYAKSKINDTTKLIFNDLQFARSEAIKRNSQMIICGSTDYQTCTENFQHGYIILDPQNNSVIKVTQINPNQINIHNGNTEKIRFLANGHSNTRATLEISSPTNKKATKKSVIIFDGGRVRMN